MHSITGCITESNSSSLEETATILYVCNLRRAPPREGKGNLGYLIWQFG